MSNIRKNNVNNKVNSKIQPQVENQEIENNDIACIESSMEIQPENYIILNKDFFDKYNYISDYISKEKLLKIEGISTEAHIDYLKAILIIK